MKLILDGHTLGYEMQNLCFLFFPGQKITRAEGDAADAARAEAVSGGEPFALTRIREENGRVLAEVELQAGGKRASAVSRFLSGEDGEKRREIALGQAFFRAGAELCGFEPPWGILTGIRPVKLMREKRREGFSDAQLLRLFTQTYLVSEEKARLCLDTAGAEDAITALSRPDSFSLYLAVPFCPSRCAYCSFVSQEIEKAAKLVPEYVRLLCEEIAETGRTARRLGLRLETVYMGGGTPTSLSAGQLREIFAAVQKAFNPGSLREYTVEAGRPETITPEKLSAMRSAGVTRISINPQTMNDTILAAVGRRHTAAQVEQAFDLAARAGVPTVNMDLIAGLPGDTPEGFEKSLGRVLSLGPQAVTVHTLAFKRASGLVTSGDARYDPSGGGTPEMLSAAGRMLRPAYRPYYLYRQRNTAGNLENVGWSLPGHEGLYNVFIMDETHTVLAAGAGGVTKLRDPGSERIERVFNFKYPYEYISRFGQIIDRKKQVLQIYEQFARKQDLRP